MRGPILHIGKYFPPHRGGMETFLADLMAAQQRAGARVAALVHSSDTRLRDSKALCEFGKQTLSVTRSAVWFTLVFAPLAPGFIFSVRKLLKDERPAVLHLHLPNPSVFWLLLLPSARALPWVVHWHSDVVASRHSWGLKLLYPLYRPLETAVLKRAAKIIATSPPYLESSEALQAHRERCVVIPLGLDPERLKPRPDTVNASEHAAARAPEDLGIDPSIDPGIYPHIDSGTSSSTGRGTGPGINKPLQLLAVGRLTYYKGFSTLISALAQLSDGQLTLVGSGALEAELRRQVTALGLDARVTLTGPINDDDLAQALADCDLLVLPSLERTEAFGMVLLEAMVFGKAVLASDVPGSGMPWLVQRSGAGEVVPPGDASALAQGILGLSQDRAKLRRLGNSGQRSVTQDFHIDIAAQRIHALYNEIQ